MHPLYQPVLDIIEDASRDIVMPYYQNLKSHQIDEKTPGDLVTVADKLSEEFISDALSIRLTGLAIMPLDGVHSGS